MARSAAALAAACLVLCFASLASAQVLLGTDSTNVTMHGYKITSNVTGYFAVTLDACEIHDVLNADTPDFARALFVYRNGSKAFRCDRQYVMVEAGKQRRGTPSRCAPPQPPPLSPSSCPTHAFT